MATSGDSSQEMRCCQDIFNATLSRTFDLDIAESLGKNVRKIIESFFKSIRDLKIKLFLETGENVQAQMYKSFGGEHICFLMQLQ